jgi:hypothetical protein
MEKVEFRKSGDSADSVTAVQKAHVTCHGIGI